MKKKRAVKKSVVGMTLIHMQSEKGRVAMMRSMETRASSRAQQPGPSGSAAHRRQL
jgi:hypothetical protein